MSEDETKKEPESTDPEIDTTEVEEFEFNDDPEEKSSTFDGAGGEEELVKKFQKLKLELKACQKEKQEYLTGWQKERADFANYKKGEDDRRNSHREAIREDMLFNFLSVMDSFNIAFANREAWEKVDPNWRKGVEYIYSQMNGIFEEYGVRAIGVVGEIFDPNMHESIELVTTDKKEDDHKVAVVIQKGYKLGERVMRPARVNVYEYKEI